VSWRPWRKKLQQSEEAVRAAECLRDAAQRQQERAEALGPRVDAVSTSLRRMRSDPLIDAILNRF
jgi:hypothetical protein